MVFRLHIGLVLLLSIFRPAFAKEALYLTSGFSFEADSHITKNQTIVVQLGDGSIELPADTVARIEVMPAERFAPSPTSPPATVSQRPEILLNDAADNEGLDQAFVRSVAKVESALRQEAISPKGALGLMQLMPATAAGLGVDPKQPHQNALGGAMYLRSLLIRYRGNSVLALAAYNAGPEAVSRFHGIPPYPETRRYINLVLREYERQLKSQKRETAAQLRSAPSRPTATN